MIIRLWLLYSMISLGIFAEEKTLPMVNESSEKIFDQLANEIKTATQTNNQSARDALLSIHMNIIMKYKTTYPMLNERFQNLLKTIQSVADQQIFTPEAYLFRILDTRRSRDFLDGVRVKIEASSTPGIDIEEEEAILYILSFSERSPNESCQTRSKCFQASQAFYEKIREDIIKHCPNCKPFLAKIDKLAHKLQNFSQKELVPTEQILTHWRQGTLEDHMKTLIKTEATDFWIQKKIEFRSGRYPRALQFLSTPKSSGQLSSFPHKGGIIPTSARQ